MGFVHRNRIVVSHPGDSGTSSYSTASVRSQGASVADPGGGPLVITGGSCEGCHEFFDFMANTALLQARRGGEHDLTERELPHLSGRRGSRPVRIGNGAWDQRQLDVYGEILGAACRLREYLEDGDPVSREFLADLADATAQ